MYEIIFPFFLLVEQSCLLMHSTSIFNYQKSQWFDDYNVGLKMPRFWANFYDTIRWFSSYCECERLNNCCECYHFSACILLKIFTALFRILPGKHANKIVTVLTWMLFLGDIHLVSKLPWPNACHLDRKSIH